MIPPQELEEITLEALRANPDLVEVLGGDPTEAIRSYATLHQEQEAANVEEAIQDMEDGTALLVFNGLSLTSRGSIPAWTHAYSLILKAPGLDTTGTIPGYLRAADVLINGGKGGTTQAFEYAEVHPSCDPPTGLSFTRGRSGDSEVWQFNFSLVERL